MSDISHDQQQHRFSTRVDGHDAYLEYELSGADMAITHTRVPPSIGGRGIAAELMRAALGAAAAHQWRVNPVCSYAVAYMKRHGEQQNAHQHMEDLLDEALEESFPASDSPAVGGAN